MNGEIPTGLIKKYCGINFPDEGNKKFESLALMLLLGCCVIAILVLPGASLKAVFVCVRAHLGRC